MADDKKTPSKAEQEDAARQRKDYLRALKEELEGAERAGKSDERIAAIKDEIARVSKSPSGRSSGSTSTAS